MKTVLLLCLLSVLPAAAEAPDEQPATRAVVAQDGPSGQSTVVVEVASGRKFTAQLDVHTDQTHLWLRRQQGSATALRPIRWDRVVRIRAAGKAFSAAEFRAAVEQLRETIAAPPFGPARNRTIVLIGAGAAEEPPSGRQTRWQPQPPTPEVRSLSIDAQIARWNANVDADGLLVHVYPLSASGEQVPASGSVEVELIGRLTDTVEPAASFCRLGHWTLPLREADFGPSGAVCRLPFQSVHPEHDLTVSLYGMVHVRLSVPGQGTFEATDGMVRLRPSSPLRDRWQHVSGQRFFSQELTSDGRR